MEMIRLVSETALGEKAKRVTKVEVEIGKISGIVKESVEFCFEICAEKTIASEAILEIHLVEPKGSCRACGEEFVSSSELFQCPQCGGSDITVLAGREFIVKSIEVE